MKRAIYQKNLGGFTLIELLVAVGIMALLAALTIAALPGIQNGVKRNRTQAFLAELKAGLGQYKLDNGIYPLSPESKESIPDSMVEKNAIGAVGAEILYKHLSGDFESTDGIPDEDMKIYVDRLDGASNLDLSKGIRSARTAGGHLIVDPYQSPIRYLADPPNTPTDERNTFNPTYDLWSIAGTDAGEGDDPSVQANYITNWTSN